MEREQQERNQPRAQKGIQRLGSVLLKEVVDPKYKIQSNQIEEYL